MGERGRRLARRGRWAVNFSSGVGGSRRRRRGRISRRCAALAGAVGKRHRRWSGTATDVTAVEQQARHGRTGEAMRLSGEACRRWGTGAAAGGRGQRRQLRSEADQGLGVAACARWEGAATAALVRGKQLRRARGRRGGRAELGRTGQRKWQARERAESELARWERSRPTGSDHEHVAQQANKQGELRDASSRSKLAAQPGWQAHACEVTRKQCPASNQQVDKRRKEISRRNRSTCTINRYKYTFALSSNSLF